MQQFAIMPRALSLLAAIVAHARASDVERLPDARAATLAQRALGTASHVARLADLEATALGKPGNVLVRPTPCAIQLGGPSSCSGTASSRQATLRPRRYESSVAARPDAAAFSFPATNDEALVFGRRGALLGAAAALGIVAPPRPPRARAEEEISFEKGADGIKYRDIAIGTGDVPEGFDLDTRFTLRLADTGAAVDTDFLYKSSPGFAFIVRRFEDLAYGKGDMPKMKVGGTRQIIIPQSLGFGSQGSNCAQRFFSSEITCIIPPESTLDFTMEIVGVKPRKSRGPAGASVRR